MSLSRTSTLLGLAGALAWPTSVSAATTDHVEVVTVTEADDDDDDDDEVEETIEITETHSHRHRTRWIGLHAGMLISPLGSTGQVQQGKRVTSNQFKACLDPLHERHCQNLRGFDVRFQVYQARGNWRYPRWMAYFRTGYTAGRATFDPQDSQVGHLPGEATSLSYFTVPLFFGGNVYMFRDFPVRPYGGLGFGFDALKVQYARHEHRDLVDASARIGFELHGGIEVRLTNYIAVTAEIMQLWSARRKLDGVPDFSNEGVTIMTGLAIGIPTRRQRHDHHHEVRKVRKVKKVETKKKTVKKTKVITHAPPVRIEVTKTVEAPEAEAPIPAADAPEPVKTQPPSGAPQPPVAAPAPTPTDAPPPSP